MRALIGFDPFAERRLVDLERLQQLHDARELFLVEPGAGMSRVDEALPVWIVDAEQQRAEVRARLPRLGPAADDELLLVDDLELAPVGRALAGLVLRVGVLRDEAFPPALERLLVKRASVAAHGRADAQQWRSRLAEHALEHLAALGQRTVAKIGAAVAEDVERDEGDGGARGAGRAGWAGWGGSFAEMNASLQLLESARLAVIVERD